MFREDRRSLGHYRVYPARSSAASALFCSTSLTPRKLHYLNLLYVIHPRCRHHADIMSTSVHYLCPATRDSISSRRADWLVNTITTGCTVATKRKRLYRQSAARGCSVWLRCVYIQVENGCCLDCFFYSSTPSNTCCRRSRSRVTRILPHDIIP